MTIKKKYNIKLPSLDDAEKNEAYDRIEKLMNLLHDDEAQEENRLKHEVALEWAMENIRVGSLVKSTVSYMMNVCDNADVEAKAYISHGMERFSPGTKMMFLGFELVHVRRGQSGSLKKVPTYELRHSWMIGDKVYYCDIHPMYFELMQLGTGEIWGDAFERLKEESMTLIEQRHGPWTEDSAPFYATHPEYESMVSLWSITDIDNPVRIDAFTNK